MGNDVKTGNEVCAEHGLEGLLDDAASHATVG
jgi:hypothetical protein